MKQNDLRKIIYSSLVFLAFLSGLLVAESFPHRLSLENLSSQTIKLSLKLPTPSNYELLQTEDFSLWSEFTSGIASDNPILFEIPMTSSPLFFQAQWSIDEFLISIDAPPFPIKVGDETTLLSQATSRGQPVSGLGMRWSIDRTDIASVNAMTGQVHALSPGVATMTLESEDGTLVTRKIIIVANHSSAPQALDSFFGLDDALPIASMFLCFQAPGMDGMPITFTHSLNHDDVTPDKFRVITASGAKLMPECATLAPAVDGNESKTVLLIGDLGNEQVDPIDPPRKVWIVGDLFTAEDQPGGPQNLVGAEIDVVSLFDFVRYAYAEVIPEEKWGQSVPAGAPAGAPIWMVQTTWQGGITPINGDTTGETERQFQRIGMAQDDGKVTPVVPFAITDIGDNDNHHELWVAGPGVPLWVEMDPEIVQDPRGDPNAADRIFIAHP